MKRGRKKKVIVPESVSQHIEEEFKKNGEFRAAYIGEVARLELARRIRILRTQRNLTQYQLAKRMHTTQQTISRLEDSKNTHISIATLAKVATALRAKLQIDFKLQKV